MARLRRLVLPGLPYHVTQRGNRRMKVFFADGDYALYRDLLGEAARRAGADIWAYCLMPNHVHLIVAVVRAAARRGGVDHRTGGAHRPHARTAEAWTETAGGVGV